MADADVKVLEPYVMCQQKYFRLQQLVKRGVVTVGACTSAENRADSGTKVITCSQTGTAEAMERPGVGPR